MRCSLCGNHVRFDEDRDLFENDGTDKLDYLCVENPLGTHQLEEEA